MSTRVSWPFEIKHQSQTPLHLILKQPRLNVPLSLIRNIHGAAITEELGAERQPTLEQHKHLPVEGGRSRCLIHGPSRDVLLIRSCSRLRPSVWYLCPLGPFFSTNRKKFSYFLLQCTYAVAFLIRLLDIRPPSSYLLSQNITTFSPKRQFLS